MKGVIVKAIGELVQDKAGDDAWRDILVASGIEPDHSFLVFENVDEALFRTLLDKTLERLGVTVEQAADVLGDYWMNQYAPKIYSAYLNAAKSAREFLLNMDRVHIGITRTLQGAKPPRFTFSWQDDNTLLIDYDSERGMIDFVVGLARGVGTYYKEALDVSRLSDTQVRVVFSA